MNALLVVIIVVAVLACFIGLMSLFGMVKGPRRVRRGSTWIDHMEDLEVQDRPNEDDPDAPIPHQPLSGRPRLGRS